MPQSSSTLAMSCGSSCSQRSAPAASGFVRTTSGTSSTVSGLHAHLRGVTVGPPKRFQDVKANGGTHMPGYAQPYARSRFGVSWLVVIYLVAGGIVAATHHYWSNLHTLKAIISAILATVLWPLILLGVNLHIH